MVGMVQMRDVVEPLAHEIAYYMRFLTTESSLEHPGSAADFPLLMGSLFIGTSNCTIIAQILHLPTAFRDSAANCP
jgi:hypothetical protein